ncbi:hypothetical protein FHW88_002661 [Mucilaginibacter sp. SG538B]|nr:hypothetical protein [Mucilaginibacter sp. SG538B]
MFCFRPNPESNISNCEAFLNTIESKLKSEKSEIENGRILYKL